MGRLVLLCAVVISAGFPSQAQADDDEPINPWGVAFFLSSVAAVTGAVGHAVVEDERKKNLEAIEGLTNTGDLDGSDLELAQTLDKSRPLSGWGVVGVVGGITAGISLVGWLWTGVDWGTVTDLKGVAEVPQKSVSPWVLEDGGGVVLEGEW